MLHLWATSNHVWKFSVFFILFTECRSMTFVVNSQEQQGWLEILLLFFNNHNPHLRNWEILILILQQDKSYFIIYNL